MQKINAIQIGKEYSINGLIVKAEQIFSYGIGLLSGLQIVHFTGYYGEKFRAVQWPDGIVYRITKVKG